jgi:hypothetical protein
VLDANDVLDAHDVHKGEDGDFLNAEGAKVTQRAQKNTKRKPKRKPKRVL